MQYNTLLPQNPDEKSEVAVFTESGSVHFLVDVDNTLLVAKAPRENTYNQILLDTLGWFLEEKHFDLLTNWGGEKVTYACLGLRDILIDEVKLNIRKVLMPLDIVFANGGCSNFTLGAAYQLYVRPFEKAAIEVAKHFINAKDETGQRFSNILCQEKADEKREVFSYLFKGEDNKTLIASIFKHNEKKEMTEAQLDELYAAYTLYLTSKDKVIFCAKDDLRNHLNGEIKSERTIEEFIDLIPRTQPQVSDLTPAQQDAIAKYREAYITYYTERDKVYSNIIKKKGNLNPPKGEVYIKWLENAKVKKNDVVVFIDDDDKELKSVREAHRNAGHPHILIAMKPPRGDEPFGSKNLTMPADEFQFHIGLIYFLARTSSDLDWFAEQYRMGLSLDAIAGNLCKKLVQEALMALLSNDKNTNKCDQYLNFAYAINAMRMNSEDRIEIQKFIIDNKIIAFNQDKRDVEDRASIFASSCKITYRYFGLTSAYYLLDFNAAVNVCAKRQSSSSLPFFGFKASLNGSSVDLLHSERTWDAIESYRTDKPKAHNEKREANIKDRKSFLDDYNQWKVPSCYPTSVHTPKLKK